MQSLATLTRDASMTSSDILHLKVVEPEVASVALILEAEIFLIFLVIFLVISLAAAEVVAQETTVR